MNHAESIEFSKKAWSNPESFRDLCGAFSRISLEKMEGGRADVNNVIQTWVRSAYENAIDVISEHAGSPIEKHFLSAMVLAFLSGDPLGFRFTGPSKNAPAMIRQTRDWICSVLERDLARGATPGSKDGYWKNASKENQDKYSVYIGMGFMDLVHITPQATIPADAMGRGKSARLDVLLWVPSKPKVLVAIECDGYQWHKDNFTADRVRDRCLQRIGIDVLRFSGAEINADPLAVCRDVIDHLKSLAALPEDDDDGASEQPGGEP